MVEKKLDIVVLGDLGHPQFEATLNSISPNDKIILKQGEDKVILTIANLSLGIGLSAAIFAEYNTPIKDFAVKQFTLAMQEGIDEISPAFLNFAIAYATLLKEASRNPSPTSE